MLSFTHFFEGLILAILGTLLVKYSFQAVNLTGPQDWIESKLGGGSTHGVYKLLGVAMVIIGLMIMTGLGGPLADAVFGPLRQAFTPPQ